jgi:hypothetical protein
VCMVGLEFRWHGQVELTEKCTFQAMKPDRHGVIAANHTPLEKLKQIP